MALFAQTVSNVNMMTLQVVTWIAHAQLTEQTSAGTCCLAQKTRDQHPLLLRTVLPLPHRCLVRELTLQSRLNHWQDAGAGLPDCALSLVTSAAVLYNQHPRRYDGRTCRGHEDGHRWISPDHATRRK